MPDRETAKALRDSNVLHVHPTIIQFFNLDVAYRCPKEDPFGKGFAFFNTHIYHLQPLKTIITIALFNHINDHPKSAPATYFMPILKMNHLEHVLYEVLVSYLFQRLDVGISLMLLKLTIPICVHVGPDLWCVWCCFWYFEISHHVKVGM